MYKFFLILLCLTISLSAKETSPINQVNKWFKKEKERSEKGFHKLGTLATVSPNGKPHTRMIELMGFHPQEGGLFFTHKHSDKVEQINYNSSVALNIWLPKTLRQISIEGHVHQIPPSDAATSWKKMPRFMKILFMTPNHHDEEISTTALNERKKQLEKLYPKEIPMPSTFVGYRLMPEKIIFFEMQPRKIPLKHIATLNQDKWIMCQVEP